MIVMAVRYQHDIDRRQYVEGNAGVIVPLRAGPGERRGALRPHRIDQDVQASGLDQPARVPDERQPHLVARNTRRWRVGVRARRPVGPGRALPPRAELPAQDLPKRFRRRAIGIEEMFAVEMIRDGAVIASHAGNPEGWESDRGRKACENRDQPAAGEGRWRDRKSGGERELRSYMVV